LCCVVTALAADVTPAASAYREILGNDSYLRVHVGWKTPVIVDAAGQTNPPPAAKSGPPARQVESAPPPAGWMQPAFDDRAWAREHAPLCVEGWFNGGLMTAEFHRMAVRGRFWVEDPANGRGAKLSLRYVGGAAVFLNGREIARGHLPAGELRSDTLAERYPDECYVGTNGFRIAGLKGNEERVAKRERTLEIELPAAALVKGVNVLALDLHRAPLAEIYLKTRYEKADYHGEPMVWSHVALSGLSLTAEAGAAVVSNVARPAGMQVWTADGTETLLHWSYGDPCEKQELHLLAPRGGRAGGWIVVGSTTAVREVRATPSVFATKSGAKLPSGAVRVSYSEPSTGARTFNGNPGYDGLLEEPPAEAAVSAAAPKAFWEMPYTLLAKPPVPGANQPVWVSVSVPADAAPGLYEGKVTVQAAGLAPVEIPVTVRAAAWQMPDDDHLVSCNNLYQSHESTALFYQVPFWSDRHFEQMGRVLELSKGLGNRLCMIHLIKGAYHLGNRESMVRWVRKPDGSYEQDYSILDRYLDLYAKKVGKPTVVLLTLFHPYVDAKDKDGKVPSATVTLLDRASGKVEDLRVPDYGTPECAAFWKPVLGSVMQRLEQRGWKGAAVLGTPSDNGPKTSDPITTCKEIWPECRLMFSGHPNNMSYPTRDNGRVPVACREHVWNAGHLYNPDYNQYAKDWRGGQYPMPWKRDALNLEWGFMRFGVACIHSLYESSRPTVWRVVEESTLQGNLCGVGRVGLDFWPLPLEGRPGQYMALSGRQEMHLGPSASTRMFLYPGPKGALPTWRSELFREGLQAREAMIFLQQALDSGRATGTTAQRIKDLLDERARHYLRTRASQPMLWVVFEGSGWQSRDEQLFDLCAEVAQGK
jgi:hypothetical protein